MIALAEVESRSARLAAFARRRRAVLAVCAVALVADAAWMVQDRHTQSYDQANYLHVAWDYVLEARHHLGHLPSYVMHRDPGHGPLYPVLISIPMGIFGPHPACALLIGVVAFIALIFTSALIAERLAGPRSVVPAAILVATTPLFYGLSRQVLVDIVLAAFCTAAIYAAIRCERFASRRWTVLLAVFAACATLTKVTAPTQIAGAVVGALIIGAAGPALVGRRERAINAALGGAVLLALTGWWYLPNRQGTWEYVKSTTTGQLSLGAGPADPLRWDAIRVYLLGIAENPLAWVAVVLALVAVALCGPRAVGILRTGTSAQRRRALIAAGFLLLWVVPPIAIQAASHNQDNRLVAPGIVGLLVGTAALLAWVPVQNARRALVGAGAAAGVWSLVAHTIAGSVALPLLPHRVRFPTPLGESYFSFKNTPISVAAAPAPRDAAAPVLRWLLDEREIHKLDRPVVVALLESHPEVNVNALGWLDVRADRGVRIIVVELALDPDLTDAKLAQEVPTFDAIGEIPDEGSDAGGDARLALLNGRTAGRTATAFAAFDGDTATFPVDEPGSRIEMHWRGAAPTS